MKFPELLIFVLWFGSLPLIFMTPIFGIEIGIIGLLSAAIGGLMMVIGE